MEDFILHLIKIVAFIVKQSTENESREVLFLGLPLNWEAIAGFLGVVLTALAVIYTKKAYDLSILTARNSITPHLVILRSTVPNDYNIYILNGGSGTAIIRKIEIFDINKQIVKNLASSIVYEFGKKINIPNTSALVSSSNSFSLYSNHSYPLASNTQLNLFTIEFKIDMNNITYINERSAISSIINNVRFKIEYTSINDNKIIKYDEFEIYKRHTS